MELQVIRYSTFGESALGMLFINGTFACYTLEDRPREAKVNGKTGIPAGRYRVELYTQGRLHAKYLERYGPDFHKGMLHIMGVPEFEGILIHTGNTDDDTDGCLLVGDTSQVNIERDGFIGESRKAYQRIYPMIANVLELGEAVWITYRDSLNGKSKPAEADQLVVADQLNFRASPGGNRMGVLFENTGVETIEQRDGWSRIHVEGWVSGKYLG